MAMDREKVAEPLLLTVTDAMRVLRVGRTTLYGMVARGDLPTIRVGTRGVRIPVVAVKDWIEQRQVRVSIHA